MTKKTFVVVLLAFICTQSIHSQANNKPVYVEENVTVKAGNRDLSIFNLYGPVKSCIYEEEYNEDEYYHREFDRNGRWLSENGEAVSTLFPKGVRRSKVGRIVFGDSGFGEIYYKYNNNGLLKKIIWVDKADGDRYESIRTFYYDKRGLIVRMEWETGDFPPTNFTILETDKYGNWTKRESSEGRVSTQTITYYE